MPDEAAEQAAADVITLFIGGRSVRRDVPGAPDGTHDFDVISTAGRVVALEITTAANSGLLRLWHSMNKFNQRLVSQSLQRTWLLTLRDDSRVKLNTLADEVHGLLESLEAVGICGFEHVRPDEVVVSGSAGVDAAVPAVDRLRVLGVVGSVAVEHRDQAGQTSILLSGTVGRGFCVRPESINGVIEHAICANWHKLARSVADERHVFVWIDPSVGATGVSIDSGRLPASAPNFSGSVDTVWAGFAAAGGPRAGVQSLWRVNRGHGWENLG